MSGSPPVGDASRAGGGGAAGAGLGGASGGALGGVAGAALGGVAGGALGGVAGAALGGVAGAALGGAASVDPASLPRWTAIDPDQIPLTLPDVNAFEFELGSTGTPYIALLSCYVCDPAHPGAPFVMRRVGGSWSGFSSDGLPSNGMPIGLCIDSSAASERPELLIQDQGLRAFEENAWVELPPPPELPSAWPVNLERDESGDLYTTTSYSGILSLARLDGTNWTALGPDISYSGAILSTAGEHLWLAVKALGDAAPSTGIWRLRGSVLELDEQFDGSDLLAFAAAPDGSLYVGLQAEYVNTQASLMARSPAGAWTSLGSLPAFSLDLRVADDGVLHAAYSVYNGNLYVVRWNGTGWVDLDSSQIDVRYGGFIQLRISGQGDARVPFLSYMSDSGQLKVWEYSRH